jgi:hypothetical protein
MNPKDGTMKKLFVLPILLIGLYSASYAQEMNQARFTMTGAQLKEALNKGEVSFFFNKGIDAEAVKKSAEYYTQYFSVVYDKNTGKSSLKLTQDDLSKLVISRFMMANGISEVIIDGEVISVQDFIAKYLR